MPEATFTIRVDSDLKNAFTEAARINDRTGAQIIRDFMRDYIQTAREKAEYERWFKAKVEAGLHAIRDGGILSHEEVKERAALRRERLLSGRQPV
jgi:predicted transcriptional regulator